MDICCLCSDQGVLHCGECQSSFCQNCVVLQHLAEDKKAHVLNYICEECDEEIAVKFCESCEQNLCSSCDTKIHNKGKRALHNKKTITASLQLKDVYNLIFITTPFFTEVVHSEAMTDKCSEVAKHIFGNTPAEILKDKINLILLEDQNVSQEDLKIFVQTIREVRLKNTLVLQTSSLEGHLKREVEKLYLISFILKNLEKEVKGLYFYDVHQDDQFVKLLLEKVSEHSLKVFLKFGSDFSHSAKISSSSEESLELETFPATTIKTRSKVPFSDENSKENVHPNLGDYFEGAQKDRLSFFQNVADDLKNPPVFYKSQPFKNVEIRGSRKVGEVLQQELMAFANKGELLIPKEALLKKLKDSSSLKLGSLNEAENILTEAEVKKLIHVTIRKFPNYDPYYYIGMLLNVLTIESLVWIIRSIKSDLMTPTEKLILSRIKECYGLKIEPNYWKMLLYSIHQQNSLSKSSPIIDIRQILDPVTSLETTALYLLNEDWVPEDQGQVSEDSEEWETFIRFIEGFFNDDETMMMMDKKEAETCFESSRWNNSVENVLSRPSVDSEKSFKVSEDIKAIPGGRYGCAQFIKYCGPRALKELSIGRLSLLVQEAINKGILRYQRTLLVKNTSNEKIHAFGNHSDFQIEVLQSLNTERKAKIISMVKEALLEILMENPNGISLAQIPFHLKRKLKFTVDFQDLGFAKLKNFLSTLKTLVVIQSVGTNHTYVKLRGPLPKQSAFSNPLFAKNLQPKKRFGDIDKSQQPPHYYVNQFSTTTAKVHQNFEIPTKQSRVQPSFGNLGMDFQILKERIQIILSKNINGILLQDLHQEICHEFKIENLNLKPFGCENLYDFLVVHLEDLVDVGAQKQGLIVYPKGSKNTCWLPNSEVRTTNNWSHHNPYQMMMQNRNQQQQFDPSYDHLSKTPRSEFQFHRSQQQQMHMSIYNEGSTLNSSFSSHNKTFGSCVDSSNFLSMSPIIFSENDLQDDERNPNVNVSTWSSNQKYMPRQFNHYSGTGRNVMQPQSSFSQEEPQGELQENLKFIEDLLQENEERKTFSNNNQNSMRRSVHYNTESFYTAPFHQANQQRFPSFYTNRS